MKQKIYYFDGYHGGQEGHMPLGAFHTILDFLDERPEWKVNLDIEPESWKLLKYRDPNSFYRLQEKIKEGRVEIVSEMYSQPLSCTLNGESVIRNFVYGRETFKKNMGDVKVENYFSQEPTFSSCLPQILTSLGYKHVSLFNSTVFAGYTKGANAPVVRWAGNDGTEILAIPNYSVNELVKHENNGSVWWSLYSLFAPPDFVEKCYDAGIHTPSAMGLQDLGHRAEIAVEAKKDGIVRDYVEFATAKDYFDVVDSTNAPIVSGQEMICVGLPWSEKHLSNYLKAIRKYEYALLNMEVLNAISILQSRNSYEEKIRDCWKRLMLTSHHDVTVCTSHAFTESMRYQLYALDNQYRDLVEDLNAELVCAQGDELVVTVFNPSSKSGRRYIELDVALHQTINACEVIEDGKNVDAELFDEALKVDVFEPLDAEMSMYNGCHKKIAFYSDFKPFECKEFILKPRTKAEKIEKSLLSKMEDKAVFENEKVKITVDLTRGGVISSYYDKIRNFEYVKEGGAFNELKGFFDTENKFVSSLSSPATIIDLRDGENVASLMVKTIVASADVTIEYVFYKESSYVDVKTQISCSKGTKIGDPYKTEDWHDLHRTFYDIKYGLNAYFATSFTQKYLDKQCAYDVCRTEESSTGYNNAKEIKHNIAVNWLDVSDDEQGLTVFVDRTTAYVKETSDEVGVSLLWGTDCACIWSSDLSNVTRVESYRIYPHIGDWKSADIWGENDAYNRKLCSFVGRMQKKLQVPFSLQSDEVEISAFFVEDNEYYLRLFNYGENRTIAIQLEEPFEGVVPCTHDKKENGALLQKEQNDLVEFSMRHFEIKTLKLLKKELTNSRR